jgi:hypothetical protein
MKFIKNNARNRGGLSSNYSPTDIIINELFRSIQ